VAHTYPYPRPSVTCDTVVFTMQADDLAVLLIQRKDEPFKGSWALPGGFVNENESLDRAAARELVEETGIGGLRLTQLGAYGDPGRDPRGHTVTVAFVAYSMAGKAPTAGDDASGAAWVPMRSLVLTPAAKTKMTAAPKRGAKRPSEPARIHLAFDHAKIIHAAHHRLARHLDNPVRDPAFELLPSRFTIAELQRIYEIVLGRPLAARAFKNHALKTGLVVRASQKPAPRPATQLYRWVKR
jgi:8-oxo-dGTP diphosphatase